MTETILDERAVSEIEARHAKADGIVDDHYAYEFAIAAALNDIPALCATVRHLREQKAQAQEDAAYSAKLANEKADEVTREVQRAFAFKQERDRLATGLANLYHVITGQTCDQSVALGMATSAVSSLQSQLEQLRAENDELTGIIVTHGDTIVKLAERFAQVEQERDALRDQLRSARRFNGSKEVSGRDVMDGENETKVAISHCALCEDPNFIYRDCVLDAAMRDKCVEVAKRENPPHNCGGEYGRGFARAKKTIIGKLESLTLDQVKPGEM